MPTGRDTSPEGPRRELIGPILAAVLLAGLLGQLNVGLADNGDYSRAMGWITSGPATVEPNWPQEGTEAWRRRFLTFWIPYWKLDWPARPGILTSTNLLWIPGAALNSVFYSPRVLYLPNLSILPRLLCVLFFLGAIRWADRGEAEPAVRRAVKLAIGLPLLFILMASDYVRFFNTFYRETGTLVYLLLFLASLVMLQRRPEVRGPYVLSALALGLLATAKVSNVYWPLVALPFLLAIGRRSRRTLRSAAVALVGFLVGAASFPFAELPEIRQNQVFGSLYSGLLTYSEYPERHLARLRLDDTAGFVGQHCYMPGPWSWLRAHPGRLSHLATLSVLLHEPVAGVREIRSAATAMQDLVAAGASLGPRAEGDPTPEARWLPQKAWSRLKARAFPRGNVLFLVLLVCATAFFAGLRGNGFVRELSFVGLVATVACPVEIAVQFFGAGVLDIARHLLVANFLFDLALTAFVGVLAHFGTRAGARAMKRASLSKDD